MWRTIISWRKQSQHPTATCSLHEMWDVRRDNLGIWLWNYRWTRLIIHPPEALFSQHQNLLDAIFFFHLQTIFILHTTEKKERLLSCYPAPPVLQTIVAYWFFTAKLFSLSRQRHIPRANTDKASPANARCLVEDEKKKSCSPRQHLSRQLAVLGCFDNINCSRPTTRDARKLINWRL